MRFGTRLLVSLLLSVSSISLAHGAHYQRSTNHPAGKGGAGGMMGQGNMSMMQMMSMMHPAIAVDDTGVYVLRGNQIFKLDKNSFQVIAAGALPEPPASSMQSTHGMGGAGGSGMMRSDMQAMMNTMCQASPMQFDEMFLQNMIRHHVGALELSRLALRKARHSELRHFAQRVIDTQSRQNKQFGIWLRDWYNASAQPIAVPMDQNNVNRLRSLSGCQFEIQYMQMMIVHHQQAVQMADIAQQKAAHAELKVAASKIAASQSGEIDRLHHWLSAWYGIDQ